LAETVVVESALLAAMLGNLDASMLNKDSQWFDEQLVLDEQSGVVDAKLET